MNRSTASRRRDTCRATIRRRMSAMLTLLFLISAAARAQQPAFIENKGQWDPQARFLLRSPSLDLWITANGVVYDLKRIEHIGDQKDRIGPRLAGSSRTVEGFGRDVPEVTITRAPIFITYEAANANSTAIGSGKLPAYHNYYVGNDRSTWAEHVALYANARVQGLYDGIDAVFYLEDNRPRYDLVVSPGADPASIRMKIDGATSVSVGESGELRIATTLGTVEQRELFAYQEVDGKRRQVTCAFVVGPDGRVRLDVGRYDRSRSLVIDPIVYSTYLGGSSSDGGSAIAAGDGTYITGATISLDFPTLDAAQESRDDGHDVFVTKLTSEGVLSFSTFLGGSNDDFGNGIAVDGDGNAFITGTTNSSNFPTADAAQEIYGEYYDAFVTKLTFTGALAYSTYLGGSRTGNNLGIEDGYGIAVDASGNAYVSGSTTSVNFPTVNAAQASPGSIDGAGDAFVTKLTPTGAFSYSTYLGGSSTDDGSAIAVDNSGNAFITGNTESSDFPTLNAFQGSLGSEVDVIDAFVTKLTSDGAISYSTYLGGSGHDWGRAIAVGAQGEVVITGFTTSGFLILDAAQGVFGGGNLDGFAAKLTAEGDLSYSTYLGGSSIDQGAGIALDTNGNAWITGQTYSSNLPTRLATQAVYSGNGDAFVTTLTSGGELLFSTYLGGSREDVAAGVSSDDNGASVTGYTFSTDFPTEEAMQDSLGGTSGNADAFFTKLDLGRGIADVSISGPHCVGRIVDVNWHSIGISRVNIHYSTDDGASWMSVASDQASGQSGGSYSWSMPDAPGTDRRVRVSDRSDSSVSATSGSFTIITQLLVTTEPVPNTPVCPGTPVSFSASTSSPDVACHWQISYDGGVTFDGVDIDWGLYVPEFLDGHAVLTISDPQLSMNGFQYRAVFDKGCLPVATSAATLNVVVPSISGRLFDDQDGDCLQDSGEPGLAGRIVEITPGDDHTTTDSLGHYRFNVAPGMYSIASGSLYMSPTCPESVPIVITISDCGQTSTGNDIAVRSDSGITDLRISLAGNRIRPGMRSDFYLEYGNVGTEAAAGTLRLSYDTATLDFVSSSAAAFATSSMLEWTLATLEPGEHGTIRVTMMADPGASMGALVCAQADFDLTTLDVSDEYPPDNHDDVCVTVTGSVDPNDKAVSPEVDDCGRLQPDDTVLAYQVRFQNTGTDTAFTVVVRDRLDASLLDVDSLTMGAASHPYTWSIEPGNELVIRFDDILLPDSTSSEPNSHGIVKYTLHLRPEIAPGTAIRNSAAIYFDFNEPVITNETVSTTPDFFVTEQPADESVVAGQSVLFSTQAGGASSVQWQRSSDSGLTFENIDGETWTSLVIELPTLAMDGYRYRAVWTNTCDSAVTDAATLHVEADGAPPVPDAATLADLVGECSVTIGAAPTASASDGATVTGTTDDPLSYDDQGTYTVLWTYDDGNGNTATQEQTVIVDDITPPTLSVSVSPTTLWTPNSTMRTIAITASSSDNCTTAPWVLSSISGDDGATDDDWSYTADTAPGSVQLRAERTGSGSGRTYTLSFASSDGNENTTTATCYVVVPHSQSGKLVSGGSLEAVAHGFMSDAVPNPFTASTDIRFTMPDDGLVSIRIHDQRGREVAVLLRRVVSAGPHSTVWSGLRTDGTSAGAGQYFYRIESEGLSETGSIVLVR